MKVVAAVGMLVVVAVAMASAQPSAHKEWQLFKRQFGKTYATRAEEARRFANFLETRERIDRHNNNEGAATGSYSKGLNHMADLSDDEFKLLNGLKYDEKSIESARQSVEVFEELLAVDETDLPAQVDWREVPGRVSAVKDQGLYCGSCWAFATTGLLEGQEVKRNVSGVGGVGGGAVKSLSEQELVDCSEQNNGCDGGLMSLALDDIKSLGGMEMNKDYPYIAQDGNCSFEKSEAVMKDSGASILPEGDELALKKAIANYGPVAVAIDATDNMRGYKRGVFEDETCSPDALNHGVLVVGYGTDPEGGDYWIVKNSWSTVWGDKGYIKMKRGVNMCGIAQLATLAKF